MFGGPSLSGAWSSHFCLWLLTLICGPCSLEWGTIQGLNQATWLLKLEVFHPLLLRVGSLPAAF